MFNENFPSNFKIKGKVSEIEKDYVQQEIDSNLNDNADHLMSFKERGEIIRKNEVPLTLDQIKYALLADEESCNLMKSLDIKPFNIPISNIHLLPKKYYEEVKDSNSFAFASKPEFGIIMEASGNEDDLVFASHIFHETMHLKGFTSIQVSKNNEIEKGEFRKTVIRTGFDAISTQKKIDKKEHHVHFAGLHEAIVAHETLKYTKKLLQTSEFEQERIFLESDEGKAIRQDISERTDNDPEDIYYLNDKKRTFFSAGYCNQRKTLYYVCKEMATDNNSTVEEMYKEFLKSHLSGDLISLSKLFEKSFGEGSFRELGNMGTDNKTPILVKEALKKFRLRMIKKQ